jgi:CubicO group peptidase (beta-lactamase class C family)
MRRPTVATTALLVACAGGLLTAQDNQFEVFAAYLDALRLQARIPGLSAAIVRDGVVVWDRGFGHADIDRLVPATPDTPYRIASLSKPFSSTLLLRCAEQGRLDLDEPIGRYSSAMPEADATVRHVLSHTSHAPPGTSFRYDGDRFAALTPVVDACAGEPYRKALAGMLDRLGMRDSVPGQDLEMPTAETVAMFDSPTLQRYRDVLGRLATPYALQADGRVRKTEYPAKTLSAAVGLVSTVRDLARFEGALNDGVLLTPESRALAWSPFVSPGGAQPYGLGWFVQTSEGVPLVWHYGYWEQFSSLYLRLQDKRLTLILLANSGELSARFNLGAGNVTESPFARLFLRMFGS